MRKLFALVVALVLVTGSMSTASAHLVPHSDGDDSQGRLDLRNVVMDKSPGAFTVKYATHDRFRESDLTNANFETFVDSKGDDRFDFRVLVYLYEGIYPRCTIYDRAGYDRGGVDAEKNPRSVVCEFFSGDPFRATRHLRWRAQSNFNERPDRAPNRGWFDH